MNELALFAGAGGGILGGHLLGWRTVCAVERDAYAAQVLAQRQNDGILPPFPIWSDVCSFDGRPWRGVVDVVSGGFPCQDISAAGAGAGIDGARSGLWAQMARIVREVQPGYVFVENSAMLTSRGLGRVLGDLAALGFDAEWGVVSAADTGAPHLRERIWILADAGSGRRSGANGGEVEQPRRAEAQRGSDDLADTNGQSWDERWSRHSIERERGRNLDRGCVSADICHPTGPGLAQWESEPSDSRAQQPPTIRTNRWPSEPDVGRVANGVAHRVDRIKALGNGQVPRVAAAAFHILSERIGGSP
ncbi:DNA cytosine methyltransferase [Bordetella genomosp. 9]|uniref:DNA cytosine methyltransferase n=1 Tax=Bordetella genomosp. 9 TaxID=1416803 RepID=UPI000A290A0E|nr:DNA cytosine methyltransferase [Bordetella genomosp. 9]